MFNFAIRSIFKRKTRVLLIVLVVALGVGLYLGSLILRDSFIAEIERLRPWSALATDLVIQAEDPPNDNNGRQDYLNEGVLANLEQLGLEVEASAKFVEQSNSISVVKDDRVLYKPYFNDAQQNVSYVEEEAFNDFEIIEGRPPQATGQIVLANSFAEEYALKLGDIVKIKHRTPEDPWSFSDEGVETETEEKILNLKIVGFAKFRFEGILIAATNTPIQINIFHVKDLRYFLDYQDDQWTRINIKLADRQTVSAEEAQNLSLSLGSAGLTLSPAQAYFSNYEHLDYAQSGVYSNLNDYVESLDSYIFNAAAIAVFVILNVFNVILRQRTAELALLRALAFSRFRLFRLVLTEVLLIAFMATLAGLILGLGVGVLFVHLSGIFFESAPSGISPNLSWKTLVWPAVLGVSVILSASLVPIWQACRLKPMAVLGGHYLQAKPFKRRLIFGLILLALGGLMMTAFIFKHGAGVLSELNFTLQQSTRLAYGILFIPAGMFVLMPIMLKYCIQFTNRLLQPLAGVSLNLTLGNLGRQLRHASININVMIVIFALTTGLFISLQSLAASFSQNQKESFASDWLIAGGHENEAGKDFIPDKAIDRLKASSALTNFNRIQATGGIKLAPLPTAKPTDPSDEEGDDLDLIALDAATSKGYLLDKTEDLGQTNLAALQNGKIIVNQATLETYDWQIGQTINLIYEDASDSVEYVIGGSFADTFEDQDFLLDTEFYSQHVTESSFIFLVFDTADGFTHQEALAAIDIIQAEEGKPFKPIYRILSPVWGDEIEKAARDQMNATGKLFSLLAAIGLLGVASTLTLAVFERRREIGILRALGFSRNQIRISVCLESLATILIALFIGGLLGAFFGWSLLQLMFLENPQLFSDTAGAILVIPWLRLGLYYLAAVALAIFAGFWPAFQATRFSIASAISGGISSKSK